MPSKWQYLSYKVTKVLLDVLAGLIASSMNLGQAASSDGSPHSTDHEGEGDGEDVVQFEMDPSGDHTAANQFNDSPSSGGSYAAHRSHESLAEDEALSREEGTKIATNFYIVSILNIIYQIFP